MGGTGADQGKALPRSRARILGTLSGWLLWLVWLGGLCVRASVERRTAQAEGLTAPFAAPGVAATDRRATICATGDGSPVAGVALRVILGADFDNFTAIHRQIIALPWLIARALADQRVPQTRWGSRRECNRFSANGLSD